MSYARKKRQYVCLNAANAGGFIMGDMGDMYRDWDALKKEQKNDNRNTALEWLKENQIEFKSKNLGSHLILILNQKRIDFCPSTNKIKVGESIIGNGLDFIKKIHEVTTKSQACSVKE
jgi:hypothetical protein